MTLHGHSGSAANFPPRTTTTGPSYPCWRCGGRILEGCTHSCPTALPSRSVDPVPWGRPMFPEYTGWGS